MTDFVSVPPLFREDVETYVNERSGDEKALMRFETAVDRITESFRTALEGSGDGVEVKFLAEFCEVADSGATESASGGDIATVTLYIGSNDLPYYIPDDDNGVEITIRQVGGAS